MKTRNLVPRGLLAALCLTLLACEPQAGSEQISAAAKPESSMAGVMVDSVNYMHDRGMKYALYDISDGTKKPVGGSIVDPLGSGGAKECCFSLPRTWHAGIKLRVEWQDSDYERTHPEVYVKELELPRYDHPADVYVVFYPQHDVEVVVSPAEPGHPEWAGRIKETPWDLCVAEHGRKVCKRAIPKLFDAASAQGFCVFLKEESPEDQHLCDSAMQGCMSDYEDEAFCKGVLWGPRKKQDYDQCLRDTQSESFCKLKFKEGATK